MERIPPELQQEYGSELRKYDSEEAEEYRYSTPNKSVEIPLKEILIPYRALRELFPKAEKYSEMLKEFEKETKEAFGRMSKKRLANVMMAYEKDLLLPPVKLKRTKDGFYEIIDGRHRVALYVLLEKSTIRAVVV